MVPRKNGWLTKGRSSREIPIPPSLTTMLILRPAKMAFNNDLLGRVTHRIGDHDPKRLFDKHRVTIDFVRQRRDVKFAAFLAGQALVLANYVVKHRLDIEDRSIKDDPPCIRAREIHDRRDELVQVTAGVPDLFPALSDFVRGHPVPTASEALRQRRDHRERPLELMSEERHAVEARP